MTSLPTWQRNIKDLHVFFEAWLGGSLPQDKVTVEPLNRALVPSFVIIDPEGVVSTRALLMSNLYEGWGSREGLRITTKNPTLRFENASMVVATYEEWQTYAGTERARLSTVVFERLNAEKLNAEGLRWLHVHETWLRRRLISPRRKSRLSGSQLIRISAFACS